MTLYLIGLGLHDERDITLKGLEIIKACKKVYFETYTSKLNTAQQNMEKLYEKKITAIPRSFVEEDANKLLAEAKKEDVAVLIIGAPLAATTHIDLFLEAKKQHIPVEVIENGSVLTAISITGLFLYKFGRITTIPFNNEKITSPYDVVMTNQKNKLHTLCLLDIQETRIMTAREGLDYLIKQGLKNDTRVVACGALGAPDPEIKVGKAKDIVIRRFPQCIIIPTDLHFKEEESLSIWK
ncbi:MAG TPA: diphthine synthase [Candidatus Nanoarchaeia archaeon]|nr:diphthine synthase [Candidatus Nanoarchaeia archaeon]